MATPINKFANAQQIVVSQAVSSVLSSGNLNRKSLRIQNKSGGSVYINFGQPVAVSNGSYLGLEIRAFEEFLMEQNCTTDSVHCRGDNVLSGNTIVYSEVNF